MPTKTFSKDQEKLYQAVLSDDVIVPIRSYRHAVAIQLRNLHLIRITEDELPGCVRLSVTRFPKEETHGLRSPVHGEA